MLNHNEPAVQVQFQCVYDNLRKVRELSYEINKILSENERWSVAIMPTLGAIPDHLADTILDQANTKDMF